MIFELVAKISTLLNLSTIKKNGMKIFIKIIEAINVYYIVIFSIILFKLS